MRGEGELVEEVKGVREVKEVEEVEEVRGVKEVEEVRGVKEVEEVRGVKEVEEVRGVKEGGRIEELFMSSGPIPFDKIKLEDYEPAMRRGMELENEEMARIADNPEAPTFENTIEAMEQSGELLGNVTEVFFNLISAETNDEMDELADKMSPILSDHANDIMFNPKLAQRVKEVYEGIEVSGEELTTEQRQLLRDTYLGFQRSGAYLPKDK